MVVSRYVTPDMCWFGMCWGHVTDVPRTGCARLDMSLSSRLDVSLSSRHWTVEVYVPHETPVVFGYVEVSYEHYAPNIYRCIHT